MAALERTRVIQHAGKPVVLFDYTGLTDEAEALGEIEKSRRFIAGQRPEGSLLLVTDGSGGRFTTPILESLKQLAAHNKPYVKASAAVSDSGLHRVVISSIAVFTGRRLPIFPTRQQALEWLVTQ